ncbi:hypothetical protein ACHAWC_005865 [Mediolabrus comicus]
MINGNGNDNDDANYHPAICDSDSECDEDHNYSNDTEYGDDDTVGSEAIFVPEQEIERNNKLYRLLTSGLFPFITNGARMQLGALAFNYRIPFPDRFRGRILDFFDQLPSWVQWIIGQLNPAQSCVLYVTEDIVHHFRNERGEMFDEDDILNLRADDLLNAAGLLPVGKTLKKRRGENSLYKMIGGGDKNTISRVNNRHPTLLRMKVFTAITVDDRNSWDRITIQANAVQRIEDAQGDAAKLHKRNFPFTIRENGTGVLLKKVVGSSALYNLLRQENQKCMDIVHQIYSWADDGIDGEGVPTYKCKDDAGNDIHLLTIEGTPEGCNEEPVNDAERRLTAIHQRYLSSVKRGVKPSEKYFLIHTCNERGEPGELVDKVQGINSLTEKMGKALHWRTGIANETTLRENGTTGRMKQNTEALWENHRQLYNGHANRWVVKVDRRQYYDAVVMDT